MAANPYIMKLSRCANHNKAECEHCGTYVHFGDEGDPCIVALFSSRICRFGTKSCTAKHCTHEHPWANYEPFGWVCGKCGEPMGCDYNL